MSLICSSEFCLCELVLRATACFYVLLWAAGVPTPQPDDHALFDTELGWKSREALTLGGRSIAGDITLRTSSRRRLQLLGAGCSLEARSADDATKGKSSSTLQQITKSQSQNLRESARPKKRRRNGPTICQKCQLGCCFSCLVFPEADERGSLCKS